MPATRRSARLGSSQDSSPPQNDESPKGTAGAKRKADPGSSPAAKRGRKSSLKEQKTIEQTMDVDTAEDDRPDQPEDSQSTEDKPAPSKLENGEAGRDEAKPDAVSAEATTTGEHAPSTSDNKPAEEAAKSEEDSTKSKTTSEPAPEASDSKATKEEEAKNQNNTPTAEAHGAIQNGDSTNTVEVSKMDDTGAVKPAEKSTSDSKSQDQPKADSGSAVEPHARDEETPSSILEKGIIYFLTRGRVGIDNPSEPDDIARSYVILRPIPLDAKIGEGKIGDAEGKCRLLALPKKVLPVSGKDKFMMFVENAKTSFAELKDSFLGASDYATKTAGTRHTPAVTPLAEGVYALTTTGRESHLAYMLTLPQELGDVQKDMGLREQGSFITSAKNPKYAGPANTNLPEGPGFPQEIIDEFRSLRWAPLQPKFLDYENTQFLLIGESSGIDNALKPNGKEQGEGDAREEMEKLEGEDEIRIKNFKGDAIFADLGVSKGDISKLQTTWET